MLFRYISLENFFRVTKKVKLSLDEAGLFLIEGENGVGKSTIFEAIVWCLWGKTVRGYTGDQIVNRTVGKNCYTKLCISDKATTYEVTRYRKHKEHKNGLFFHRVEKDGTLVDLTQKSIADTESKIETLLGIDYETFIHGPMMPKGSFKKFSEMTDAEIKSTLENVIQTKSLSVALDITKTRLNKCIDKIAFAKNNLSNLIANSNKVTLDLDNYAVLDRDFDKKNKDKIAGLIEVVKESKSTLVMYEEELNTVVELKKNDTFSEELAKAEEILSKYSKAIDTKNNASLVEIATLGRRIREVKEVIKENEDSKHNIDSIEVCPTCLQDIDKNFKTRRLKEIDENIVQLEEKVLKLEAQKAGLAKILDKDTSKSNDLIDKFSKNIIQLKNKVNEFNREVAKEDFLKQKIRWVSNKLSDDMALLVTTKKECSPYKDIIANLNTSLNKYENDIKSAEEELVILDTEKAQLEFWKFGFGNQGLKSSILDVVIPYMNQRASEYSQLLTGGDMAIEFHSKIQLKSGEFRDKFYIDVKYRNGAESYIGSSSGEKARVDLILNFTLSDLVSARAMKAYPQRFFDEPFESLDEAGVDSVINLLTKMTNDSHSIFVISHEGHLKSLFDRTISIRKENGITTVN